MTVKQIQALLTYLGYDPGDVDGSLGKNTRSAVSSPLKNCTPAALLITRSIMLTR